MHHKLSVAGLHPDLNPVISILSSQINRVDHGNQEKKRQEKGKRNW